MYFSLHGRNRDEKGQVDNAEQIERRKEQVDKRE